MATGPEALPGPAVGAPPVALNLELSHGRHGAAARVELHDRPGGRVALLAVYGWLDAEAVSRLGRALEDLAVQGVHDVLLDCSRLDHVDYRIVPALVERLARFESRVAGLVVCGLSHHLRDLFRLAGCDARLRCWPSAADLLPVPPTCEPRRECAS